ncbi:STAS domain-containing protein [Rhodococcus fascians]|uniref:STAS domain-containing protein n=1 Tax=Rhodococcoides fascians TaxID=1828 RepID=UPI001957B481|nr:STAS domain-containing protein [Rhodococcus fascians]MBM7241902.1 STAS domain-containing protein [Rhodococcus fascians]MBY3808606.1 STAS domain-containing protein [Rhodococcus fascians]MBY3840050.1 STAS domain-containing protein [Rhodococcus fascians]MBY3845185.1 STAS domain-containing protein [Rhodococcus fascians]MBY3848749.1 STAS domain-containing protein [Rhodococcus fascians]
MVFLRSVHSDPESIRLSFCGPTNLEDSAFAMSVDEPIGGPVVIRIIGKIDRTAVPVLGECVSEAIVCGRSMIVDLLDVDFVHPDVVSILSAAASRLSSHRCRAMVACTTELQEQLRQSGFPPGIDCYATVADAIRASLTSRSAEGGRIRQAVDAASIKSA